MADPRHVSVSLDGQQRENLRLTSYLSKLEELQQEVRSIKEAVGKSAVPSPIYTRTLPPINTRDGLLSHTLPPMRPFDAPVMLPPVLTPSVTTTPTPKTVISSLGGRTAEPRALKSRAFSGEDINYYFDKYVRSLSACFLCRRQLIGGFDLTISPGTLTIFIRTSQSSGPATPTSAMNLRRYSFGRSWLSPPGGSQRMIPSCRFSLNRFRRKYGAPWVTRHCHWA